MYIVSLGLPTATRTPERASLMKAAGSRTALRGAVARAIQTQPDRKVIDHLRVQESCYSSE